MVKSSGGYPERYKDVMIHHPLLIVNGTPVRWRTIDANQSLLDPYCDFNIAFTSGENAEYYHAIAEIEVRPSGRRILRIMTNG